MLPTPPPPRLLQEVLTPTLAAWAGGRCPRQHVQGLGNASEHLGAWGEDRGLVTGGRTKWPCRAAHSADTLSPSKGFPFLCGPHAPGLGSCLSCVLEDLPSLYLFPHLQNGNDGTLIRSPQHGGEKLHMIMCVRGNRSDT